MDIDWPTVGTGGLIATLVGTLVTSWRFFFVEVRKERDFWRAMALGLIGVSEKATNVAEAAVHELPEAKPVRRRRGAKVSE